MGYSVTPMSSWHLCYLEQDRLGLSLLTEFAFYFFLKKIPQYLTLIKETLCKLNFSHYSTPGYWSFHECAAMIARQQDPRKQLYHLEIIFVFIKIKCRTEKLKKPHALEKHKFQMYINSKEIKLSK